VRPEEHDAAPRLAAGLRTGSSGTFQSVEIGTVARQDAKTAP
jgi:hypothetical protein